MRNATERTKRRAAITCAVILVCILAALVAVLLYPVLGNHFEEAAVMAILILYALAVLAVIVGVLIALGQRLKEIKGGEEEDAKKY